MEGKDPGGGAVGRWGGSVCCGYIPRLLKTFSKTIAENLPSCNPSTSPTSWLLWAVHTSSVKSETIYLLGAGASQWPCDPRRGRNLYTYISSDLPQLPERGAAGAKSSPGLLASPSHFSKRGKSHMQSPPWPMESSQNPTPH